MIIRFEIFLKHKNSNEKITLVKVDFDARKLGFSDTNLERVSNSANALVSCMHEKNSYYANRMRLGINQRLNAQH